MGEKSRRRRSSGVESGIRDYEREVSWEMVQKYGLTWADACGDAEPLMSALRAGQSATAFVRWWGEKYGLVPVADTALRPFGCSLG